MDPIPNQRNTVEIAPIISDYDGKTYFYPKVSSWSGIQFTAKELAERVTALENPEPDMYGLRGIHLSPKLEDYLNRGVNGYTAEQEYLGFEWLTNIGVSLEAEKNGVKKPRQLKLLSKQRYWDDFFYRYRGDLVCERFSIHPESREFVGDDSCSQHAGAISRLGSYPFEEYVRFVYKSSDAEPNKTVLLSRAYYNDKVYGEKYGFEVDKEKQLQVLALLVKNGLPEDTEIYLSVGRQVFKCWGID